MSKTVCVIGAGIGGLMAGALLAKEGWHVTVVEKATTVGGSAGSYARKNRRFPTGATIAFGLEERGLLDTLFHELDMNIPFELLHHPMDILLDDRKISIFRDKTEWENEMRRAFPERIGDVLAFWRRLEQISEAVYAVTETRVSLPIQRLYDLGNLPLHVLAHPGSMLQLARYATHTVEDLLRMYKLDSYTPLRQFLDAQLLDAAQTDCTEAALLPSSLALNIYRRGSFYVEKGMGQLSEALAQRIIELGGEVLTASPVKELQYEDSKWRISSRKRNEVYDTVINNTGISFGPGTSHSESEDVSWGAYRIDALLNASFWHQELNGRPLPFALQIVPEKEQAILYSDGHGPVYVTFQPAYNRQHEPVEDEIMMTCSIHTQSKQWEQLSKEDYQDKKNSVAKAMFQEIQKVLPVEDYLLYSEAGTPLTYQKYIGKTEVGGFPLTVRNAILKPKSVRSSHPQLYIAGEQAFPGPGTLSSALSGYHAARAIMKSHPS
ncbi:phytoene desaturase family protein [Sporosarcina gallistercoris]|uniref:FAD-dependent oxidoreductase n=1 Tax=Sporosarcina gallistercoris TaxID=2762245 RepID=A0ABR8PM46_9BACL|nr:NAD(P)/FAD-dependent oxidoreductase [Sporosarcina gallistercoris]MBD7909246.1 FAD-dependent oxidoreductase [Sporosarcina gallistercoris]